MRQITQDELNEILRKHALWLGDDDEGERADFSDTDLSGLDLSNENLININFVDARLISTDFRNSKLNDSVFENAELSCANFSGSDLSSVNFIYSSLDKVNLSDTDLWNVIGNMVEIKSLQLERWAVVYTSDRLQISTENHSIQDWWSFSDERIAAITPLNPSFSLEWWKKYKPLIKQIIETSPAQPTGWKA